jgi:hypothetical protein
MSTFSTLVLTLGFIASFPGAAELPAAQRLNPDASLEEWGRGLSVDPGVSVQMLRFEHDGRRLDPAYAHQLASHVRSAVIDAATSRIARIRSGSCEPLIDVQLLRAGFASPSGEKPQDPAAPGLMTSHGPDPVLVVTDKGLVAAGLVERLLNTLEEARISFTLYDEVQPNPAIQNVEDGVRLYLANGCKGIVAFGGGSPMDCAKLIGARATNPKRSVHAMKGMFKVRRKLPPLFAVPTTAGTGSETTVAAVISDPEAHEKFAVVDLKLVPPVAVLDPELMLGLPPHITAATGMDALTHAVEAYIGLHGTRSTDENAEKAGSTVPRTAWQTRSSCLVCSGSAAKKQNRSWPASRVPEESEKRAIPMKSCPIDSSRR